jgi:hydrogenase nickel incorporation protein HypA/HybF
MHELSIMESALQKAIAHAKQAGGTRICRIRLRIGALSGVVPEALEFAFASAREGTMAEEASLEIEPVAARFHCSRCDQDFSSAGMIAQCPICGQFSTQLLAGREMELASLEIE